MRTMSRGASRVCVALAIASAAGAIAASVGAEQAANGDIAFAATVGQETRLFTVGSGQAPVERTAHATASASPSWSPDGTQVVVSTPRDRFDDSPITLSVIDLATGAERALTGARPSTQDREPTWSPDGRWIAFTRTSPQGGEPHVMVIRPDGSNARVVAQGEAPAWSPDSRQIAYVAGYSKIFRISLMGAVRRIIRTTPSITQPPGPLAWSPDGRRIAYVTNGFHLWWTSLDRHHLHSLGVFRSVGTVAWTTDGRHLLVVIPRTDFITGVRLVSIGRDRPHAITIAQLGGVEQLAWSANRRSIAMTRDGELWTAGASGANARPVTPGAGDDRNPAYSPDGSEVAYVNAGRLTVAGTGGGPPRVPAPSLVATGVPAWSPDGRTIAVWSLAHVDPPESTGTQLLTVDVASGSVRPVSQIWAGFPPAEAPQWSPDGRYIAYHWTSESAVSFIQQDGGAVTTADGAATVAIGAIGRIVVTGVAWAPDGSKLLVAYHDDAGWATSEQASQPVLAAFDLAAHTLTPLPVALPTGTPGVVAFSPDGAFVAINLTIASRERLAVLRPDGSDLRVLDPDSTLDDRLQGWSPDSTRVLVTRGELGLEPTSVWSLGVAGGDARQETPAGLDAFEPTWQALPVA